MLSLCLNKYFYAVGKKQTPHQKTKWHVPNLKQNTLPDTATALLGWHHMYCNEIITRHVFHG